jgi:hypothetical protein
MSDAILDPIMSGLSAVVLYLAEHVLTCLIPAFFIAGAIVALVKKDAILRYFGASVEKWKSYSIASISGTVLAVCSCTILPIFSGIYKKGSGIGPATTFLFAGPAINILAIIYTAQVLGYDLGVARAGAAIASSIIIGLIMAFLFRKEEAERAKSQGQWATGSAKGDRPRWAGFSFFLLLVLILVIGASPLDALIRAVTVLFLTIGVSVLLIYYFTRDEVTEWGRETWDLTKKIFPILIVGTFVVGIIAFYVPPSTFQPYLGSNSVSSVFLASVLGAFLYMPTLLEVPIIGTTFGYTTGMMAGGPALALLLSGPTISLPSMIVLWRMFGGKHTIAYVILVIIMSTVCGVLLGPFITR